MGFEPGPTRSGVRYPAVSTRTTDCSTQSASKFNPNASRNIIVALKIDPIGLAESFPASVGADPCIGSNSGAPDPKLADGISPIDPTSAAAASLKMSPNILVVSITSNCEGFSINCIAALSTYMFSSVTFGRALLIALTVRRHTCELVSTLALSTEHNRCERFSARAYANAAIRSISGVEYDSVSHDLSVPPSVE